jgi:acetyltransferase
MTRKPAPNADGSADLDKSLDILGAGRPSLEVFFRPRNAAVIGATETAGSVGRTLMANFLRTSFGGAVYPVNPKRSSVMGVRAYARVADLPEPPDLAVIVVPAPAVPEVVGQCAVAGARGAIVISAGFREVGPAGAAL